MATSVAQPLQSLLVNGTHRFATCWKLVRTDGFTLRLTDHDQALTIDGESFVPGGSFLSSARQMKEGLDPQNMEVRGALISDSITQDDLRAGLYRLATVTEFAVDWRFPFTGKFYQNSYKIEETVYNNETWVAKLAGFAIRLQSKVGNLYEKTCRWDKFGNEDCAFNLATVTQTGRTVSTVSESRLTFTSTDLTPQPDNYYNDGVLTWTTGANAGLKSEVYSWINADDEISLQVQTPFEIAPGDAFTIYPGCDGQASTCKRYNNYVNFGGFPDMPGNDEYYKTPDAQG